MKRRCFLRRISSAALASLILPRATRGAEISRREARLPPELARLFAPPPEFAEKFGAYRSPLLFEDGSRVAAPADWTRRAAEIRKRWEELIGRWPALIEKPRVEFLESKPREEFIQHRVRIEIAPGQTLDGLLLIPKIAGKLPAVLVPFYDADSGAGLGKPRRDFGYQLTRRGFVTLSIGSPGGDARQPSVGGTKIQPLSFLGYIAANCANALAQLPEVDAARIGVVGHSYGGKWAMFASCLSERFACAAWSDPGIVFDEKRANVNYWEPWYLGEEPGVKRQPGIPSDANPRTGAYRVMIERGIDLHELHALMAPRPFLVSGGSEDPPERWLALNHTLAVNRLLGVDKRVGMDNRPAHEPTEESNARIYQFFEHWLK